MADRCPLCGSTGAQCGPRSAATSRPVDALEEVPVPTGSRRRYLVRQPNGRDAILNLDEADAARLDARPLEPTPPPAKTRTARNKARRAQADK